MSSLLRRASSSSFARNGLLVFAGILGANAFNYLYYLLIGRSLSVLEYGVVMSLVSAVLVVMSIGTIGQVVIAKLTADLNAAGDRPRLASFASSVARISLVCAAVILALAFLLQRFFADYLHLPQSNLVVVAGAAAAVGFALPLQRGLFQGRGSFANFAISSCLDGIGKAVLVVPLTRLLGAAGALLAFLGATVGSAIYGEFVRRRDFRSTAGRSAHLDLRRIFYTAGATGTSTLAVAVLLFYDVVLAKHFLDPLDAGLYGVAALGGRALFTVVAFLPTVLLPEVAGRSQRAASHVRVLAIAVAVTLGISALCVSVGGLFPELAVRFLAGRAYLAAAPLVLPYLLAASALAFANLLTVYSIARHRFAFVPWLLLIAFGEITLVTLRHGSAVQIVQDVLVGHASIALLMGTWLAIDLSRNESKGVPAGTSAISID